MLYLYRLQMPGGKACILETFFLACSSIVSVNTAQKLIVQYDPECVGYVNFQNIQALQKRMLNSK